MGFGNTAASGATSSRHLRTIRGTMLRRMQRTRYARLRAVSATSWRKSPWAAITAGRRYMTLAGAAEPVTSQAPAGCGARPTNVWVAAYVACSDLARSGAYRSSIAQPSTHAQTSDIAALIRPADCGLLHRKAIRLIPVLTMSDRRSPGRVGKTVEAALMPLPGRISAMPDRVTESSQDR